METTELFSEIANRGLARLWAQHPSVQASVQASSMRTLSFPLKLNSLVRLPEDYSELVNNVSTFSCPNVGVSDGCRVPAMCLICGKVICSQSYCCQGKIKRFSKGQVISKCPFGFIVWTKMPTKLFLDLCPEFFCSFLGASWKLFGLPWDLVCNIINKEACRKP